MGKSSTISTLGKVIANVALHKLVAKHTNRVESANFLSAEINAYRDLAIKTVKDYHWNDDDKEEIRRKSLEHFNKKATRYSDLSFSSAEIEKAVLETMRESGL